MPIPVFGPRLDVADAVGTDGRPRWRSLLAATVLVVAFFGAIGYVLDALSVLGGAATGAGLVAAAVALLNREDDDRQVILGHALLLPAGLIATLALGAAFQAPAPGLGAVYFGLLLVVELTAFAGAAAWANTLGERTLTHAVGRGWLTVAMTFALVIVGTVVATILWGLWAAAVGGGGTTIAAATTPGLHLTWTFGLLGGAAFFLWVALGRLPIVQLTAQPRRDRVREHVARVRRLLVAPIVVGFTGWWVFGIADLLGLQDAVLAVVGPGVASVLGAVTGSPVVRVPLLIVGLAALVATGLTVAVRRASLGVSQARETVGPLVGAVVLSFFVAVIAGFAAGSADGGRGPAVFAVVLVAGILLVLVVVSLFLLVLSALPLIAGLGFVPDRGAAPALMSAGVFLVAVVVGLGRGPSWLVFAGVALSLSVWDLAEFARGLTEELGHRPDTRRVEAVHGVAAGGLALVGLGLATGLDALVRVAKPSGTGLAMALAALGLVLLLSALRA